MPARSPQQRPSRNAQRAPPSWLEGATRDSDPPISNRRHRLALSSQQQTMPQALSRWDTQADTARAGGSHADRVALPTASSEAAAARTAIVPDAQFNYQASLLQRVRSTNSNRFVVLLICVQHVMLTSMEQPARHVQMACLRCEGYMGLQM